jgi:uncharacterized protein (DUF4213/DUF364 family)
MPHRTAEFMLTRAKRERPVRMIGPLGGPETYFETGVRCASGLSTAN